MEEVDGDACGYIHDVKPSPELDDILIFILSPLYIITQPLGPSPISESLPHGRKHQIQADLNTAANDLPRCPALAVLRFTPSQLRGTAPSLGEHSDLF